MKEMEGPKPPGTSSGEAIPNGEKVTTFTPEDTRVLRDFLSSNIAPIGSSLTGTEDGFDYFSFSVEEKYRNFDHVNGSRSVKEEVQRMRALARKLDDVTKRLPRRTVCRFVASPDPRQDILGSVLETGGLSPDTIALRKMRGQELAMNAQSGYVDDILRGAEYQFRYDRDFYLLVYDTTKLRRIRADEQGRFATTNYAWTPVDGESFQSALAHVLRFKCRA